jgi:hypothetical protein
MLAHEVTCVSPGQATGAWGHTIEELRDPLPVGPMLSERPLGRLVEMQEPGLRSGEARGRGRLGHVMRAGLATATPQRIRSKRERYENQTLHAAKNRPA